MKNKWQYVETLWFSFLMNTESVFFTFSSHLINGEPHKNYWNWLIFVLEFKSFNPTLLSTETVLYSSLSSFVLHSAHLSKKK